MRDAGPRETVVSAAARSPSTVADSDRPWTWPVIDRYATAIDRGQCASGGLNAYLMYDDVIDSSDMTVVVPLSGSVIFVNEN